MNATDKRKGFLEYLHRILRERPQAAVVLAEILGPPPSLRGGPRLPEPEEPQPR